MDVHDVVTKLIGPVEPIGKTEVDAVRYDNLEELLALTDLLLGKIEGIKRDHAGCVEASRKKAGMRCAKFLTIVGDVI